MSPPLFNPNGDHQLVQGDHETRWPHQAGRAGDPSTRSSRNSAPRGCRLGRTHRKEPSLVRPGPAVPQLRQGRRFLQRRPQSGHLDGQSSRLRAHRHSTQPHPSQPGHAPTPGTQTGGGPAGLRGPCITLQAKDRSKCVGGSLAAYARWGEKRWPGSALYDRVS